MPILSYSNNTLFVKTMDAKLSDKKNAEQHIFCKSESFPILFSYFTGANVTGPINPASLIFQSEASKGW
jgi:hypothetical protein